MGQSLQLIPIVSTVPACGTSHAGHIESETNPNKIILKADSLLLVNENEKDKYKSQIKGTIEDKLRYLKAELFLTVFTLFIYLSQT